MSETWSLFFALSPEPVIREQLAERAAALKQQHPTPSPWVRPERYHLSLPVVGVFHQAPDALAQRAIQAAAQIKAAPFELLIDQAGCYAKNPKIPWWLKPSDTPEGLKQLWRALRETLKTASLPCLSSSTRPEPHISVVYNAQRSLPDRRIAPLSWTVQDFVLIESRYGGAAADTGHRVLGRWALQGGEPDHARQFDLWDNPG
ncbi:2'-5' RNA ligase family protein [Hydrocarboniphaga sp.]|uniref:2'-5' RNA ligase family protein n=1 Tax=Hydrocarboniphaga sp. TaxID=2033016 RepID=UPI003D0F1281